MIKSTCLNTSQKISYIIEIKIINLKNFILFVLLIFQTSHSFSQSVEKKTYVYESLSKEKYKIINHPKSLVDFQFNLPSDYQKYRLGRDNSVIEVFNRIIANEGFKDFYGNEIFKIKFEFTINVMKYLDYPKYKKLSSMSSEQIRDRIKSNILNRDKNKYPNEIHDFHEKNNLFWMIVGFWDKDKDIYVLMSTTYLKNQSISLSFTTNENNHVNKNIDVVKFKKLLDTFLIL